MEKLTDIFSYKFISSQDFDKYADIFRKLKAYEDLDTSPDEILELQKQKEYLADNIVFYQISNQLLREELTELKARYDALNKDSQKEVDACADLRSLMHEVFATGIDVGKVLK